MDTSILPAQQWAQLEFANINLGDSRRNQRLRQVATGLVRCPSGTLPQAFPDWAELKAAYRLFSNPQVSYEKIIEPHCQRTRQRCSEPGEYLLIEDTSELDYTAHRHCQGLGQIGNKQGRGLWLHTTLAVEVKAWDLNQAPEAQLLGVAGQKCWARPIAPVRRQKETQRQRFLRARESERWAEILHQLPTHDPQARWIYIADREADIYETFARCQQNQTDFIIRAQNKRVLAQEDQSLFEAVAQRTVLGCFELEVRQRPERSARVAKLEIRSLEVTLRGAYRPSGTQPGLKMWAVEVREVEPPPEEEPVHWLLLTSLPAISFTAARRIVARYAKRWLIEEFHKALKTGANVEKSELETAERLRALVGVLVLVAVRLVDLKMQARCQPQRPIEAKAIGQEAMQILTARFGQPAGGWTYGQIIVAIARLGGFLARRGDGNPGWITIWRGWQRLMTMADGILSISKEFAQIGTKRCG